MRKSVVFTFGLLALILLAGGYLLRPSNPPSDKKDDIAGDSLLAHPAAATPKAASPQVSVALPVTSVQEVAEAKATPELLALLESYQTGFVTADYKLTGVYSNLVEELKSDPAKLPMVVDWMKSGTNAELTANLAEIICKNCGLAGSALLEKAALDLAKDTGSPAHRNTALNMLSALTQPGPDAVQTAALLAQTDDDPKNRASAIDALGKWMVGAQDADMQGNLAHQLATAINAPGADEKLRGHAFTYLANQKAPLSADVLQTMPNLLQQQSDPEVRQLAASVLGQAADDAKDYAMKQLEDGLVNETNPDTKRVVASQIIRLGKNAGLEQVRQLAGNDPDLIQQMEGYLEMLKNSAPH